MAQQVAEEGSESATTEERTAEIHHLPFTGTPGVQALRHEIRFEGATPSQEQVSATYEHVGTQTITETESAEAALGRVWAGWNNGSGEETRAFIEARVRSLSVGDIVVLDGDVYLCRSFGWDEIKMDPEEKLMGNDGGNQ